VKNNGLYPRVRTDTAGTAMVSQGGAVGLVETVRILGLDRALSEALVPWRKPNAVHNPGKIITDLALSLAVGGDCLADIAVLRDQPGVFGAVASDPRGVAAGGHPRRRRGEGAGGDRRSEGRDPGPGVVARG